ncbi:PDZ domain-containing protein [Paenibacillus sp. N1-5-1-14]|uniref:YlbL family protein n=1 Tax=Paenibacillus radicibacter TaxID=2972488 RepID=UPI002158AC80|nr:S16 family serine protease [Paenibacillus radicibacter]MCR8645524.1 PDZ domain-containing protein [Paenibacillus radicibacter]
MFAQLLRRKKLVYSFIVALVLIVGVQFIYLPYQIRTVNPAESISERVAVAGSEHVEKGDFLFTSILSITKPNPVMYLYYKLQKYAEFEPIEKVMANITNLTAYNQLMEWMRDDSEQNAIIAAYRYLQKPILIEPEGVIVQSIPKESKSYGKLQEGDIIIGLEGENIRSADDLRRIIAGKKDGDVCKMKITRGREQLELELPLMSYPSGDQTNKVGFYFYFDDVKKSTPTEEIKFNLDDIGGPSAGLMLSLDIVSKIERKDYTRGYKVAGTGTMDEEGNVGQIGGIKLKIVGASQEGAEYFFVPKDVNPSNSNEKDAKAMVAEIGSNMKLVPVATLKEATEFLLKLPEK